MWFFVGPVSLLVSLFYINTAKNFSQNKNLERKKILWEFLRWERWWIFSTRNSRIYGRALPDYKFKDSNSRIFVNKLFSHKDRKTCFFAPKWSKFEMIQMILMIKSKYIKISFKFQKIRIFCNLRFALLFANQNPCILRIEKNT